MKTISLDDIDEDSSESNTGEPTVTAVDSPASLAVAKPSLMLPSRTTCFPPDKTAAGTLPVAAGDHKRLPDDLKSAIDALKKAEALPGATKAQKSIRDEQLARLRSHVARLQEGLPIPDITAKALGSYHHMLVNHAKRERLELLARSNPEIAELLKERDELAAAITALAAKK